MGYIHTEHAGLLGVRCRPRAGAAVTFAKGLKEDGAFNADTYYEVRMPISEWMTLTAPLYPSAGTKAISGTPPTSGAFFMLTTGENGFVPVRDEEISLILIMADGVQIAEGSILNMGGGDPQYIIPLPIFAGEIIRFRFYFQFLLRPHGDWVIT